MKKNFHCAFSLMEMMVVLLIVAIIAAATAPMITKKMARNAGSGDSPWVFTGLGNSIAYNMNGNDGATAIIGNVSTPSGWNRRARLFIDSGNNAAHIAFGNGNATPLLLTADPQFGRIGFSNDEIPNYSVAFGTGQTLAGEYTVAIGNGVQLNNAPQGAVAIGVRAEASGDSSIALGLQAKANSNENIAIGSGANSTNESSIALGVKSNATGKYALAIGDNTEATEKGAVAIGTGYTTTGITGIKKHKCVASGKQSIAIGFGAEASGIQSTAIGWSAKATEANQIVLGTAFDTVYIPGNLKVGRNTLLGAEGRGYRTWISNKTYGRGNWHISSIEVNKGSNDDYRMGEDYSESAFKSAYSDRRLKNVGEKYTAGLDELKKLDFYHYTFKADKDNTPLVGVIAQDLQKVFPDSVTKDDDGYLRIRLEDMFYAVINAVKELDTKISEIVTTFDSKLDSQNQRIESLEKQNSELQKQNEELQEEIKDIEKRIKKLEK